MKLSIATALVVLLVPQDGMQFGHCASFRGLSSVAPLLPGDHHRHASSVSRQLHMEDFMPLACNAGVGRVPCTKWSTRFGTQAVHQDRVIVNCGECVEMDFEGPELVLQDGIDIRGRLEINHGTDITINTTMVAVQGEFIVRSRKAVDGTPAVKIITTGDSDQFFEPIEENAMNCNHGDLCKAGKKSIVVAGGRVRGTNSRRECLLCEYSRSKPHLILFSHY